MRRLRSTDRLWSTVVKRDQHKSVSSHKPLLRWLSDPIWEEEHITILALAKPICLLPISCDVPSGAVKGASWPNRTSFASSHPHSLRTTQIGSRMVDEVDPRPAFAVFE